MVITGSRYAQYSEHPRQAALVAENLVRVELGKHMAKHGKPSYFFHGDAPGADRVGGNYMEMFLGKDRVKAIPADWRRYGRGAGPKRNRLMLDQAEELAKELGQPYHVIAFLETLSVGTRDCLNEATDRELATVITTIDLGDLKGDIEREKPIVVRMGL